MEKNGVSVETLRPIDYNIAAGVYPDMTEHGWEVDDWPEIYKKVEAANILVITAPIWLGEKSSVCTGHPSSYLPASLPCRASDVA